MKTLTHIELFQKYCEVSNQFGLLLSYSGDHWFRELYLAAPFLNEDQAIALSMGETLYLFFKDNDTMMYHYHQMVGDDGPTKLNSYHGPVRVYALTCDNKGNLLTENT